MKSFDYLGHYCKILTMSTNLTLTTQTREKRVWHHGGAGSRVVAGGALNPELNAP